ncbi:MAG: hypothetical protein KatS3mg080_1181 [Anoxybacillus sp.]|nr:MAG: hypothetical protein KatS3mg080_1181 [Anoxybacillus sp.]
MMKRIALWASGMTIMTLVFISCSGEHPETKMVTNEPKLHVQTNAASTNVPSIANTGTQSSTFALTPHEQQAYEAMKKDLNEEHLKELNPISIAKIYVQASLDGEYDVVYALYTDRLDRIRWSKEEDEKIPPSDRGTREMILTQFQGIEKGIFIQTSEDEGYIKFTNENGKFGFQMIKDDDDIWNVAFMPIQ